MRFVSLTVVAAVLQWAGLASAQHEEQVAPKLERFWTEQVAAVQPRAHAKAGRFELLARIGVIPNDPFLIYVPVGVRVGYHLNEHWALEAGFGYNLQADTGLKKHLEDNDAQLRARVRDRQQLRAGAGLGWSPAYGKVALGSETIVHFDAHLVVGGGIVRTEEDESIELTAATRPDFYGGVGLRIFLGTRWLVTIEFRQHVYLRPKDRTGGGGGVGFPSEISLGGGLMLGRGR